LQENGLEKLLAATLLKAGIAQSLRAGRSKGRSSCPGTGGISFLSLFRADWFWSLPSLLFNRYCELFPRGLRH
jgi:hypothetical protein